MLFSSVHTKNNEPSNSYYTFSLQGFWGFFGKNGDNFNAIFDLKNHQNSAKGKTLFILIFSHFEGLAKNTGCVRPPRITHHKKKICSLQFFTKHLIDLLRKCAHIFFFCTASCFCCGPESNARRIHRLPCIKWDRIHVHNNSGTL